MADLCLLAEDGAVVQRWAIGDQAAAVGRDETADITITLGTLGWRGQQGGELARGELRPEQEKILKSLRRHWTGLCVFVDHPQVPMDNNTAERTKPRGDRHEHSAALALLRTRLQRGGPGPPPGAIEPPAGLEPDPALPAGMSGFGLDQ